MCSNILSVQASQIHSLPGGYLLFGLECIGGAAIGMGYSWRECIHAVDKTYRVVQTAYRVDAFRGGEGAYRSLTSTIAKLPVNTVKKFVIS